MATNDTPELLPVPEKAERLIAQLDAAQVVESTPARDTCSQCGRPAIGRAFATTAAYVRCSLGHVWSA